jgi:HEAT repeat protein
LALTGEEAERFLEARKDGDVEALLDALRHPDLRPMAVRRLGVLRVQEAIPRILPLLHSPSAPLRRAAANALGQLQAREAIEPLFQVALSDSDRAAREWALFAIGCIGLETEDTRILRFTSDPEASTRVTAIGAMLAAKNPELVASGVELRHRQSWRLRRAIRKLCRRIEAERGSRTGC